KDKSDSHSCRLCNICCITENCVKCQNRPSSSPSRSPLQQSFTYLIRSQRSPPKSKHSASTRSSSVIGHLFGSSVYDFWVSSEFILKKLGQSAVKSWLALRCSCGRVRRA